MDPITSAIIAALMTGVLSGVGEVGKNVVVDAYTNLKTLLKRKFGEQSDIVKSVDGLEAKPDSSARKEMLKEEVTAVRADQDSEIRKAAEYLLQQISRQPGGERHIQSIIGNYNTQADHSSSANVNINQLREQ